MKKPYNIFLFALAVVLLTTACKSTKVAIEQHEQVVLPTSYNKYASDTLTSAKLSWKTFFPDTLLQNYIAIALTNNQSFRQINERVSQASAIVLQSKGALLPDVNLGIDAGVNRFGEYTMDGVGNKGTTVPDPYRNFGLGINFSWEADIWGKLSNKKQAALAQWMASAEAVNLAQTVLVSEVSNLYFQLIALDKRHEVLVKAIDNNEKFINLTTVLKEEGDATQLSVDRFSSRKLMLREQVYAVEQQTKRLELSLSTLLGVYPFEIARSSFSTMSKMEFPLAYGVPSQLLQLRPDVKASEHELYAAKADVNAARAAFYPSLVLNGGGGFNSFDIGKLFTAPASLVYDLAAGITAPIFKRNEIKSLWEISKSNQRIALSKYHETALKAYSEVLGLISDHSSINKRLEVKKEELAIDERSIKNANTLFRLSFIDYLDVLSAEEQFLTCQLELIELVVENSITQANLYRAIGGGYLNDTYNQSK